jgi:hypothetical protein
VTRSKLSTSKHSAVGKRLIGAMREVQALEFARRVREVREGLGLAQSEFAQQFGLSLRSLQKGGKPGASRIRRCWRTCVLSNATREPCGLR